MGGLQATSSRSISIIVYVFIFSKRYLRYGIRITVYARNRHNPNPASPACLQFGIYVVVREQL